MVGGVVTQQWTVGDRIPGVNNYAQVNKVFSDCDYKGAPQVSVTPSGLPGFSVGDAPSSFLSSLKFWGGKRTRKTRKTMKKGKGKKHMKGGLPFGLDTIFGTGEASAPAPASAPAIAEENFSNVKANLNSKPPIKNQFPFDYVTNNVGKTRANKNMEKINTSLFDSQVPESEAQQGGAGGLAYGPSFEVIGPNPVRFETRLGCESGAAGPQPPMMQAADTSILSKLKFWGGKKTRNARKTRKNMKGGSAPFASAFDIQDVRGSPYTLTPPGGNVYEVPTAGFRIEAPLGGNNAGQPPYDQVTGYPSAPVLAGPCMKGGKRRTHRKSKKHGKRRSH
jgi:hypothetical protein